MAISKAPVSISLIKGSSAKGEITISILTSLEVESSAITLPSTALGTTQTFKGPPAVLKTVSIASGGGGHKFKVFAKLTGIKSCGVSASYPLLTKATISWEKFCFLSLILTLTAS